jgi:hypothetical protein
LTVELDKDLLLLGSSGLGGLFLLHQVSQARKDSNG